jgi:hypothetical protein
MDHCYLENKNRWEVYWNVRTSAVGMDDVLEVTLGEDLELGDSYEQCIYEEGDSVHEFYRHLHDEGDI